VYYDFKNSSKSEVEVINIAKKMKTPKIRNYDKFYEELKEMTPHPRHPPHPIEKSNMHESYLDPFSYLDDKNRDIEEDFLSTEISHTESHLFKAQILS
jgi:oligopeptidase B